MESVEVYMQQKQWTKYLMCLVGAAIYSVGMNYASAGELLIKRLMDILAGVIGCIVTAVIFVFVRHTCLRTFF